MSNSDENKSTDSSSAKPIEGSTTAKDEKNVEYLANQLKYHDELLTKYKNAMQELTESSAKSINELEDKLQELKKDKLNIIEIIAIFVAIFAFLSVEFQILKSVTGYLRITGLSVVIFASLLFFITNLSIIANRWLNKESEPLNLWGYNFVAGSALIVGIFLVGFGDYKNPADIENNASFLELKEDVALDKSIIEDIDGRLNIVEKNFVEISKKKSNSTQNNAVNNTKKPLTQI